MRRKETVLFLLPIFRNTLSPHLQLKTMETNYITLTPETIDTEHICCAISDKKCQEGYAAKKAWLKKEFANGYVFRRLDERAKVFIEYVPAEKAWLPVEAPGYLLINCFWVSGRYKGQGHGKALLQSVADDGRRQGKNGLVTVAGIKKLPFMSDTQWLRNQGFEIIETLPNGFCLLAMPLQPEAPAPAFKPCVQSGACGHTEGLAVYYTDRCPYPAYYIHNHLAPLAQTKGIPLKIIKLETREEAQNAPTPATLFSLFYNGRFITTDLSVCLENRFDKIVKR